MQQSVMRVLSRETTSKEDVSSTTVAVKFTTFYRLAFCLFYKKAKFFSAIDSVGNLASI